ncbi:MAG: hypothetical protein IKV38_04020 [Clostridia bacterium]|nr:hypothetical protein [Clostridia bacterium]
MSKSIYSLVLNDELISMLDKVAHKKGMSRSNMINTIIADYLSYETPEKRMQYIYQCIESLVQDTQNLKFVPQTSSSYVAMCSAISFRYNPTVKYSIEMFNGVDGLVGELRVNLRSTNAKLILALNDFFTLFNSLENKYLGNTQSAIVDGRFIRRLYLPKGVVIDNETMGEAFVDYVKTLDALLNEYFMQLNTGIISYSTIEREYAIRLKNQRVILY